MKSERLLSIMVLLANRTLVSASELAHRYGVSVRTIYRDVETLSTSGVPIVTEPGRSGGISLMEDFKIDRHVVRPAELSHVLSGLEGLATAVSDPLLRDSLEKYRGLLRRAPAPCASAIPHPVELHMELTPSRRERGTIEAIQQASAVGHLLELEYIDASGRVTVRKVETYALVFQWSSWLLYAWCRLRGDYRLFKLSRIKGLKILDARFSSRQPDLAARPWTRDWEQESPVKTLLRFLPGAQWTALEYFEPDQITTEPDGSLLVRARFPVNDWAVAFLSGFGGSLEVLTPPSLRERMKQHAEALLDRYSCPASQNPDRI